MRATTSKAARPVALRRLHVLIAFVCATGSLAAQADRVVMFSSYGTTAAYDYNGDSWAPRTSGSSLGGAQLALAYDSESDRVVMVSSYGSTAAYDYGTDSWASRASGSSFGGAALGAAYDVESDRIIVFSSYGATLAYDYNLNTWETRISGSSLGGAELALAYDVESDRVIMFSSYGTTAAYDYNSNAWASRTSGSSLGGADMSLAYDVESDRVIMSSSYGTTAAYDYNSNMWESRAAGASFGGAAMSVAYDTESDRSVVFSSYGTTLAYDYNSNSWATRASGSSLGGAKLSLAYAGDVAPNAPECTITSPLGGMVSGDVTLAFDVLTPSGNDAVATLEWSTDSGVTFASGMDAGSGSLTGNPTAPFPAGSHTWVWNSDADVPFAHPGTVLRITTADSVTGYARRCQTSVDVDNVPTCAITNPAGGALLAGRAPISLSVVTPSGNLFAATIEWSTDGGSTFAVASDAGGGTLSGNPTTPAAGGAHSWRWDTPADLPLFAAGVILRVTVADSVTGASSGCQQTYAVDNIPTCLITAPPGGSVLSGSVLIAFNVTPPSGNLFAATMELSTNGGVSFALATDAGGGTLSGNPTSPAAAGSYSWQWDTHADIPFAGSGVLFRLTARDVVTSAAGTCQQLYDVDNNLTCGVSTPPGTARRLVAIEVMESTTAMPPLVNVTVEWSPAGAGTFALCTMGASSPNPNPLAMATAGLHTFVWDSMADGVAPGGPQSIDLRVSVSDSGAATTCADRVDVDNSSLCLTFCGDCDGNGLGPSILDALTAAQIAAGTVMPTVSQSICCDTNSSLSVNVLDALLMAQSAAGLAAVLSCP